MLIPACIPGLGGGKKITSFSTLLLGIERWLKWIPGCEPSLLLNWWKLQVSACFFPYFNWPFQDSNSRKKENRKAKCGASSAHSPSQMASEMTALVLSLAAVWKLLPAVPKLAMWTVTKFMQEWTSAKDRNIVTRIQHFTTPFVFLATCKRRSCAISVSQTTKPRR